MGTAAPTNLERGRIGFATLLTVDILFRCALVFFNNRSGQRELLLADNPDFGPNCGSREFTKTARRMLIKGMAMNAGCLKPLKIILPEGSMVNPKFPAAVVAGNVEVSQNQADEALLQGLFQKMCRWEYKRRAGLAEILV